MKQRIVLALLLTLMAINLCHASVDQRVQTAKNTLDEFLRTETNGGRLTEGGWKDAGRFFISPGVRPQQQAIAIVSAGYDVEVDEISDTSRFLLLFPLLSAGSVVFDQDGALNPVARRPSGKRLSF
jgi:hypothetical protein